MFVKFRNSLDGLDGIQIRTSTTLKSMVIKNIVCDEKSVIQPN